MEWQPIETAPKSTWDKPVRLILWNQDEEIATFGRVIDLGNGSYMTSAEGYNGRWLITHWMPCPEAPESQQ